MIFQGADSDYYFCSRCKSWYEIFLNTKAVVPLRDKRRIKAVEYYLSSQFQSPYTAAAIRAFIASIVRKIYDVYVWFYRFAYRYPR